MIAGAIIGAALLIVGLVVCALVIRRRAVPIRWQHSVTSVGSATAAAPTSRTAAKKEGVAVVGERAGERGAAGGSAVDAAAVVLDEAQLGHEEL